MEAQGVVAVRGVCELRGEKDIMLGLLGCYQGI